LLHAAVLDRFVDAAGGAVIAVSSAASVKMTTAATRGRGDTDRSTTD
jgi:hypothetical protein